MTQLAFVTGCSRSGTTALVDLLNAHLQVGIGMERYKTRYFERDVDRVRDLFTFERFFDFREGDTNIVPSAAQRWANFYDSIRHKMDDGSLSVIGDKPLAAPPITAMLSSVYPDARWVFIFRDVAQVAASYIARADNPDDTWPTTKRHAAALEDCRRAFVAAEGLLNVTSQQVFVVEYSQLFSGHQPTLEAMNRFLGLERSESQLARFQAMTKGWDERARRPVRLSEEELRWLDEHRDRDVEMNFLALAESSRQQWSPSAAD